MPTVDELKAQLVAAEAAEAEAATAATAEPILTQIKNAGETDSAFIDKLRIVAGKLKDAGQIVEEDMITAAEQGPVFATLLKAVGELIA
jgi:hypothetical protein